MVIPLPQVAVRLASSTCDLSSAEMVYGTLVTLSGDFVASPGPPSPGFLQELMQRTDVRFPASSSLKVKHPGPCSGFRTPSRGYNGI
jgi:hypothetical protein